MDEVSMRRGVEAAAGAIWTPPRFAGEPPHGVEVEDVVPLDSGALAIGRRDDDLFVAPVIADGAGVRRARPGDGVFTAMTEGSADGSLAFVPDGSVLPVIDAERAIEVDQSNESVILGERVVLKVFLHTRRGPQPGADLPAHLAAVGFTEMPAPFGTLVWRGDTLVATAVAFVPGARDGWEWYVEMLERAVTADTWDAVDAVPGAIGGVVARLHRALATPSAVIAEPRGIAPHDDIGEWRRRAEDRVHQAAEITDGAAGERLGAIVERANAVLARLDDVDETPVQRIHGDLHVGQLLRAGDGPLLVTDFDGNPLAPTDVRTGLAPTARDVASMLAAIDHVGRVVARRQPAATDEIETWIDRSRDGFLDAYRAELGPDVALFDERLLHPFAIEQEAHEFLYATRYLPRWTYVPDAALPAALHRAEAAGPA